jgi:hypothetical protein
MNKNSSTLKAFDRKFQVAAKVHLTGMLQSFLKDRLRKSLLTYWAILFFVQAIITTSASGYDFNPPRLHLILIQVILVLFVVLMLPRRIDRVREILPVLTALFLTIPTISIAFTNTRFIDVKIALLALLYVLLNQVIISILVSSVPQINMFRDRKGATYSRIAITLILFAILASFYAVYKGLRGFELTSFSNIYSIRDNFSSQLLQINDPILGHLVGWLGAFIPPILFVIAIKTKNYFFGAVTFVITSLIYAVAGQKWIIALVGIALVLYLIGKPLAMEEFLMTHKFVNGMNALFVFAIFLQTIFINSQIVNLVVRRTFLDPSIMLQYYTKYSLEFPMGFWRESKIAGLVTGSQTPPISNFIGDHYFNFPTHYFMPKFTQMNGTAGTLADSIAQAGLVGLIFATFLVFGFLILLESLSINRDNRIVFVISSLSIIALFEGTLLTLLFSRGLILIPLIMFFLPRDARQSSN